MSAPAVEWKRIELLGQALLRSRRGDDVGERLLAEMATAQEAVQRARASGGWWETAAPGLEPVQADVLACVVAPDAEPRIGWLFQALQGGTGTTYPSPALVQELLALDPGEAAAVYAAVSPGSPLIERGLVETGGDGPYDPLRPARGVTARLLGRSRVAAAPPGSTEVRMRATWDDLVLPPDRVTALREFLAWIIHRPKVANEWGARVGGGPVALFTGPSGTGKTLAGAVLASELSWPIYRVDIALLVSKYIGETEKNLNRLFDAAHGQPLLLQIDEADSLFGRRGDVKEARDRYANLEVSHLLARIENHEGPCILTTNLKKHLDQAFIRRFQVVVEFPRPDAAARARLWAILLPPHAPRSDDVDFETLGRDVNLTGGGIRNSALHAAFLAADGDGEIGLRELAVACWRELTKDGRDVAPVQLGHLRHHLPAGILAGGALLEAEEVPA